MNDNRVISVGLNDDEMVRRWISPNGIINRIRTVKMFEFGISSFFSSDRSIDNYTYLILHNTD